MNVLEETNMLKVRRREREREREIGMCVVKQRQKRKRNKTKSRKIKTGKREMCAYVHVYVSMYVFMYEMFLESMGVIGSCCRCCPQPYLFLKHQIQSNQALNFFLKPQL